MRLNKKAQLQIMENTFVLLIIFIIFIVVFFVILIVNKAQSGYRMSEIEESELIKKSQILNFLPEMQCSDNNNLDPDCYDIMKVEAFMDYVDNNPEYYQRMLGHIRIGIEQFNPSTNNVEKEWEVYDFPNDDLKGERAIKFPVLLRDVTDDSDYFGIIHLWVYT